MRAYNYSKPTTTSIKVNDSYQGERLEEKIQRIVSNKEPISDSAPIVYTERKDGVLPQYDIRADRWDIAVEAMDAVSKTYKAKREERIGARAKANMEKEQRQENKGTSGAGSTDVK